MARILTVYDDNDLGDIIFGEPSRRTLNYIREKVDRFSDRFMDTFDGFFEDTRDMFNRFNSDNALRRISKRIRDIKGIFEKDIIKPLYNISDIQGALPEMQRYVMAHPESRRLEELQSIDCYSDSYRNKYPGRATFDDPDYMRVIDGVLFTDNTHGVSINEKEDAWVSFQDLFYNENERDLYLSEQDDILSTWDILEMFYKEKDRDPTSVLNEKM